MLRLDVAFFRRWAEPLRRLRKVFHHSQTRRMRKAEVDLGLLVAVFGGLAIPIGCLSGILRHAVSLEVSIPEAELCFGVGVNGGGAKPAQRFLKVLLDALPSFQEQAQVQL